MSTHENELQALREKAERLEVERRLLQAERNLKVSQSIRLPSAAEAAHIGAKLCWVGAAVMTAILMLVIAAGG